MIKNEPVYINRYGETSRDFCHIVNTIQANLLAATTSSNDATDQVYNVAIDDRISLNQLYSYLRDDHAQDFPHLSTSKPLYLDFRAGNMRHSVADISEGEELLGYLPSRKICDGLTEAMQWYVPNLASK